MDFSRSDVINPLKTNHTSDQMIPVSFQNQQVRGIIGSRMDSNIERALLNFPVEEYLRVYHGDRMARWAAGEYLGKYMQAVAISYQYSGSWKKAPQTLLP